ncbi:phage antirepressor KilAC domain-containing protein [Ligilactobacillus salivarius]|nr:phage antirepressor KilAC domain-containing protein [Ligilactobacillus salivarius]
MNELKILGTEKVGNFKFTGIEGGFGENKKAMLVRDIAVIHGKEVRQINQAINMNRKRFKDGIDVIDFLNQSNGFRKFAEDNGLIGSNRTQHVYLLSERGYAKLLKILEDDKAWEIYDELVDNYFNMRQSIKQYKLPQTFSEALIELAKEVKKNEVLKPKAEKYDRYLSNKGLITITEIAKEYGMSGVKLNQFLRDKRVIYKRGNKWFVYQKYANERYVGYEIHLPEGRRSLKWTPEGEMFIRELLENNNIKPVLEQPQQLTVQEPVKYSGKYYTASSIAYNLGLSEEWIMKIGEIANNLKLKPRFSDENIYCRKTLDDNGFPRWEYTQYGAALIENEINKFRLANQI